MLCFSPLEAATEAHSEIFITPLIEDFVHFCVNADFYCQVVDDVRFCYETENEFVVYFQHSLLTDACLATCTFKLPPDCEIRCIICEGQALHFDVFNENISFNFEISGLTGPTRTLYVHTILREPGLTLRIEQNDLGRRAGMYKDGDYPVKQIAAANHYMFAMREVVKQLGLPKYLNENHLGYLLILGFETNNEIHTDFPPHWHFIFRWPNYCGSQAPHLYLDENGKMTYNMNYVDGIQGVCKRFDAEKWCRFVDMYGKDVLAFKINGNGGMSVTKPNAEIYTILPYDDKVGATILKNDEILGYINVKNDVQAGKLTICCNSVNEKLLKDNAENILYNPLTGAII